MKVLAGMMMNNGLSSLVRLQPTMSCYNETMNYKRHNQGLRAHIRRKNFSGYWLPKEARVNRKRNVSK